MRAQWVDKILDMWNRFASRSAIQDLWNSGLPHWVFDEGSGGNERSAMQVATVFACVRLIAGTIATTPLELFQEDDRGGKKRLYDEPEYYLFADAPNDENTSCEYFETLLTYLLLQGNGFSFTPRTRARPVEAWNIQNGRVSTSRVNGDLVYFVTRTDGVQLPERLYQGDDMWHLKRWSYGETMGSSIIKEHARALGVAKAQEIYTKGLYDNGMMVGSVVETDQEMDTPKINALEKKLAKKYSGAAKAGRPLILPFNLKFRQITMTPEDAQMIEAFNFNERQICKIFGVPPHMVANLDRATFSNIENQFAEFIKMTLMQWAVHIERSMKVNILNSQQRNRGWRYKFNLDALGRAITADRYKSWSTGINGGFLTPNEAREKEDLPPKEGGDDLKSPLNMTQPGQADGEDPQEGQDSTKDQAKPPADNKKKAGESEASKSAKTQAMKANRALVDLVESAYGNALVKTREVKVREGEKFNETRAYASIETALTRSVNQALNGLDVETDAADVEQFISRNAAEILVWSKSVRSDAEHFRLSMRGAARRSFEREFCEGVLL